MPADVFDERLDDLLERWTALRQQGQKASAEVLCADCPELTGALRKAVAALAATAWLDEPVEDDDGADAGEIGEQRPEDLGLPAHMGRYQLNELVGVGGFGQVWRAFDPELQRTVAVKVARAGRVATPEQAAEFIEEARKVAQLKHPGIVPIYDVGRQDRFWFFVSAYVEGGNLAARIAGAPPSPSAAAGIIAGVAETLDFAHKYGFIHRDIKPANILLDAAEAPLVTDFGIAIRDSDARDGVPATAGTLPYMSPEQLRGGDIDHRTDIYSLGVVLYQTLAGRLPFDGQDASQLSKAILEEEALPPRTVAPNIPAALEEVCLRALAKDQDRRFQTMKEFAAVLRAAGASRPRAWRPALAVAALVLIVAVAWVTSIFIHRSNEPSAMAGSSTVQAGTMPVGGPVGRAARPAPSLQAVLQRPMAQVKVGGKWATVARNTKIYWEADAKDATHEFGDFPPELAGRSFTQFTGFHRADDEAAISFTVVTPGVVLLATNHQWGDEGNFDGSWEKNLTAKPDFIEQGWTKIADMPNWELFYRDCQAGESFKYRTCKYHPPILIR